jgi:hypothetical protein
VTLASNQRGGQANEAGSVYRRGVAGIVAAHGLLSKGIAALGLPDAGPYPVSIAFETTDAVDDIVTELSDGTRVYMQAKRIYGDDSTFESAVLQLVAMLDDLQEGDRLVVVSAYARGDVKELPEALRVRRAEGVLKSTHQKALDALAKRIGLPRGSTRFERFCDTAYAWHVSADSAEDGGYQLGAALLDNTVVETPHGAAAFGALLARLHSEAGSASRSRTADWWAWLNDARLPLLAGPNGPAAPRLTAERDALDRYRRRLSLRKDMVEFALISDDHPPVRVPNMLSSIRVARSAESKTGYELTEAVRRHQHVVLLGLPGSGKTSAVVQLAAHLAEDLDAPLPIFTKLQRACCAVTDAHDITIPLLVNDAIHNAPEQERAILAEVLARELSAGCALLICDGLDECGSRASMVADGLARLREGFSPDVGLVVTTRPSSSGPAGKLALRESWLLKPMRGDAVQRQILDSVMARLELTDEQRTGRQAKLKQVQRDQPELARVPLLGNLIALLVGVGRDTTSADTVADILENAVEQSLSRWEAHRSRAGSSEEPTASLLSNGVLWDGFIEIGRLLAQEPTCARNDATARVEEVLVEHWSKGARDAQALAPHVVNFWDATISVFVEDHTGVLTARSRVFVDLADALWVSRSSKSAKVEWIREAVIHENRYENFLLACMKVPDLPDLAMSVIDDTDARRHLVQWLCDAATQITLSDDAISGVLDHLAAEAHRTADWIPPRVEPAYPEGASPQERQKLKDGHAWPFVRRAASLPLPPHLRTRRDALIARVRSDPERAYTAITLASTTDTRLDSRLLSQNEISALISLLALPRPVTDDRLVQTARNRYAIRPVEPMISGRAEAMLRATRCLDQLPDGSAEKVVEFIKSTTEDNAIEIEFELEKHGYRGPLREQLARIKLPRSLTDASSLAACLVEISEPASISARDTWWCREAFELYALMQLGQTNSVELRLAAEEPHRSILTKLARLYCDINSIDAATVSAQMQYLARQGQSVIKRFESTAITDVPVESTTSSLTALDVSTRALLISALTSANTWLGQLAFFVSFDVTDGGFSTDLIDELPSAHPWGRYWATLAACKASPDLDQTASRLLAADGMTRAAFAKFLLLLAGDDELYERLLATLRADKDLSVRLAATPKDDPVVPGATEWTCSWCARTNLANSEECAHCDTGVRPQVD